MNKLDEILKPKLTKTDVRVLAKLLHRRWNELLERYQHLCKGSNCVKCIYRDDCKVCSEFEEAVDKLSEALGIEILLGWGEYPDLTFLNVKRSWDDEEWVYCHEARVFFNPFEIRFEPLTKVEIRENWRFIDYLRRMWLERELVWFFRRFEDGQRNLLA